MDELCFVLAFFTPTFSLLLIMVCFQGALGEQRYPIFVLLLSHFILSNYSQSVVGREYHISPKAAVHFLYKTK